MRGLVLLLTIVTSLFGRSTSAVADDSLMEKFESKKAAHQTVLKEAKTALEEAFDKKSELAGKIPGASSNERIKTVDALSVELKKFKSSGYIPFSPLMREPAIQYLEKVNRSAVPLAKEYERQINRALKDKNNDLAKSLVQERDELSFVVGSWDCYGVNFRQGQKFTWNLYSDFTVNPTRDANNALPKGWSFTPNGGLLIKNFAAGAPKGGFNDKCSISWDGQLFEAKNQLGGVYTGHLQ